MALAMRTKASLRSRGPCELQVSRFGPPKTMQVSRFGSPKRSFQVWTPKTCRFPGLAPKMCKPARLGGSKPANVHVLGVQTWTCTFFGSKLGNLHVLRGSNLETSTFWGGPNLEACTFGASKPGILHVLGGPYLEMSTFWGVESWKPARFGGFKPGNLHKPGSLETWKHV